MKFETEMTQKINVEFSDPKKAEAFFIESDWKETFYTFTDLSDVVDHLAFAVRNSMRGETYDSKSGERYINIEGFPTFSYKDGKLIADESDEHCGIISIYGDNEAEPSCTHETS